MNEIDVLEKLKKQLKTVNQNLKNKDFSPEKMQRNHPKQAPYYLKCVEKNLYKGIDHDKLDSRANAIKSSAAMILNTLGKSEFYFNGKKYGQIEYEEELKAIKTDERKHNAHLDAKFVSYDGKEINFVEAKFLEWFSSPKNLSEVYLSRARYFPETGKTADIFIKFFESLLLNPRKKDKENRLVGKYRKYDAIQMTIHILGIYNFYKSKEYNGEKIKLLNIVWDNDSCSQYKAEKKQADEYLAIAREKLCPLFHGNFEIEYVPYSGFYDSISYDDPDRKKYLKRYILD